MFSLFDPLYSEILSSYYARSSGPPFYLGWVSSQTAMKWKEKRKKQAMVIVRKMFGKLRELRCHILFISQFNWFNGYF